MECMHGEAEQEVGTMEGRGAPRRGDLAGSVCMYSVAAGLSLAPDGVATDAIPGCWTGCLLMGRPVKVSCWSSLDGICR